VTFNIQRYQEMCETTNRTMRIKVKKEINLKFYNVITVPTFLYRSGTWVWKQQIWSN